MSDRWYAFWFLLIMAIALVGGTLVHMEQALPRLVGTNCLGSNGPLYANEEDHFPTTCEKIERNDDGFLPERVFE